MVSFIEYLIELEQTISFDPVNDAPADVVAKVKQAQKIASASPERALRKRQQAIGDAAGELKSKRDDPLANDKLQVKKMEERITRLKMSIARKEAQAKTRG